MDALAAAVPDAVDEQFFEHQMKVEFHIRAQ
jgi:hypothetical protein